MAIPSGVTTRTIRITRSPDSPTGRDILDLTISDDDSEIKVSLPVDYLRDALAKLGV